MRFGHVFCLMLPLIQPQRLKRWGYLITPSTAFSTIPGAALRPVSPAGVINGCAAALLVPYSRKTA